jgi:hypothetical protein
MHAYKPLLPLRKLCGRVALLKHCLLPCSLCPSLLPLLASFIPLLRTIFILFCPDAAILSQRSLRSNRSDATSGLVQTTEQDSQGRKSIASPSVREVDVQEKPVLAMSGEVVYSSTSELEAPPEPHVEEIEAPWFDVPQDYSPLPPPCYKAVIPLLSVGALRACVVSSKWKGVKFVEFSATSGNSVAGMLQEKPAPTCLRVSDVRLPTYGELHSLKSVDSAIARGQADGVAADSHVEVEQTDSGERELVLTMFEAYASGEDESEALVCASILPDEQQDISHITPGGAVQPQFTSAEKAFTSGKLVIHQRIAFSHMLRKGATHELEPLSGAGQTALLYISLCSAGSPTSTLYQALVPVPFGASEACSHQLVDTNHKPVPGASIRINYTYCKIGAAADDRAPMDPAAEGGRGGDAENALGADKVAQTREIEAATPGALVAETADEEIWDEIEVQEASRETIKAVRNDDSAEMVRPAPSAYEHVRDWL